MLVCRRFGVCLHPYQPEAQARGFAAFLRFSPPHTLPVTIAIMAALFVGHPHATERIGDILAANLGNDKWTSFDAAVAFAKASGVKHIAEGLATFCRRHAARILIGLDFGGTSEEGLSILRDAMGDQGEIWIATASPPAVVWLSPTTTYARPPRLSSRRMLDNTSRISRKYFASSADRLRRRNPTLAS